MAKDALMTLWIKSCRTRERIDHGRYRGVRKTRNAERRYQRIERRRRVAWESEETEKIAADMRALVATDIPRQMAAARAYASSHPFEIVIADVVCREAVGLPRRCGSREVHLFAIERRDP